MATRNRSRRRGKTLISYAPRGLQSLRQHAFAAKLSLHTVAGDGEQKANIRSARHLAWAWCQFGPNSPAYAVATPSVVSEKPSAWSRSTSLWDTAPLSPA
jgi:hypothetical protein